MELAIAHLWWIPVQLTHTGNVVSLPDGVVIHVGAWGCGKKPAQSETLFLPKLITLSKILPIPAHLWCVIYILCMRVRERDWVAWHECMFLRAAQVVTRILTWAALHSDWGSNKENILRQRNLGSTHVKSWSGGGSTGCRRSWITSRLLSSCWRRTYSRRVQRWDSFQAAYHFLISAILSWNIWRRLETVSIRKCLTIAFYYITNYLLIGGRGVLWCPGALFSERWWQRAYLWHLELILPAGSKEVLLPAPPTKILVQKIRWLH